MELGTSDLNVILVPDGELGDDVRAVAVAWSEAGLLKPSVWVSPSSVDRTSEGPPHVQALKISAAGTETADLFTLVGLQRLERLRLIAVHLSGVGPEQHDAVTRAALEISELLKAALPLGTSEDEQGTNLHRVKLLVPASGSKDLPPSALQQDWEVNAVVSPEDRPDVDRGSVFVRPGHNYVGHVVNAVCAAGGLWAGMPTGALDTVTTDSTTSEGWLHVIRPTVRAVLGSSRTERVVEQALRAVGHSDVSDFVTWGRKAPDPVRLTQRAAERLLSSGNWSYPGSAASAPRTGRDVRSASEALSSALQYNVRLFGAGWRWLLRSGEASIDRGLTEKIMGREAEIDVAVRPESPATLARWAAARRHSAQRSLSEFVSDEGLEVDAPLPETWRDLRRMTLALVDGGPLPPGVRAEGSGTLREVVPRAYAVPAPDDTLELDGLTVGIVDAVAFRRAVARLEAAAASEAETAPPAPEAQPQPKVTGEKATEAAEADAAAARAAQLQKEKEDAEKEDARRKSLEATRTKVAAWFNRRRGSFLWLVAEAVADELATAQQRRGFLENAQQVTTDSAFEGLNSAFRRLVGAWRFAVLVLFAGLAYAVWRWLGGDTDLTKVLLWTGIGLVVWILAVAWANHRYFRADLRYRREIDRVIAERRQRADELVELRRRVSWLQTRYDGLMTWAGILAEVVHRPWGRVPVQESSLAAGEIQRLPAAVALAVSADSDREEFGQAVVTDAVNVLCPPEYASRMWENVFESFLRHNGRDSRTGIELVDRDELQTRASPRRELLHFLQSGVAREEAVERAVQQLDEAIDKDEVRLPSLMVKRLGPYSDGQVVPEEEFYGASLRVATPFTLDLWTPEGQLAAKHLLSRSLVWVPRSMDVTPRPEIELRRANGGAAVRVDLSRRCSIADVTAFTETTTSTREQTWSTEELEDFN